ncbi:MAG: glycosyl hydrolase family 8 [Thermotogota bacterium]
MKKGNRIFVLIALILMCFLVITTFASEPQRPFPQHTVYTQGTELPSNRTQKELDNEVIEYYRKWKQRYLHKVPNVEPSQMFVHWNVSKSPWVYPTNAVTVSEAHGYGMLTLAFMAGVDEKAQELFDAMYRFYKAHPSSINPSLMAWKQLEVEDEEGNVQIIDVDDNDSATDGDMDIAYALILADNQWGSDGAINYREEGIKCIQAIYQESVNKKDWIILMGDWVNKIKTENPQYYRATRGSDIMLDHIRLFAAVDRENAEGWQKVYDKTIEIIDYNLEEWSVNTGLLPDFLEKDENGNFVPAQGTLLETENDGDYNWNACRVPWRIGVEYLLNGHPVLKKQLSRINDWIAETTVQNPLSINPGYYIRNGEEGAPIIRDWEGTDMGFIAPFGVSACADDTHQDWLNALWDTITADSWSEGLPFAEITYYPNTIRMLSMIAISGNWWLPE